MNSYMHNKVYFSHYQPTLGRLLMWEVCFVIDSYIYCTLHFLKMFLFCARTCMCNRVMCLVESVCVHIMYMYMCVCMCVYKHLWPKQSSCSVSYRSKKNPACMYYIYYLFMEFKCLQSVFFMSNESYRQSNLCVFYLRLAMECCITVYHT